MDILGTEERLPDSAVDSFDSLADGSSLERGPPMPSSRESTCDSGTAMVEGVDTAVLGGDAPLSVLEELPVGV